MKQDRIVVITGAAGDMGSVFVARFLANGDTVIATDNRGEELNELPSHTKLSLVVGDISKEEDCEKIAELVCKGAKRVDVLINCAGHFPINPFEQMSADNWRHVIDINLTGNFLMTRAVLPLMEKPRLGPDHQRRVSLGFRGGSRSGALRCRESRDHWAFPLSCP
jgi:NAD(P)-dependent dehydrogenase (short-subunit alcohol dehydrogenase family)